MPFYEIKSKNDINLFHGFMDLNDPTHAFKNKK